MRKWVCILLALWLALGASAFAQGAEVAGQAGEQAVTADMVRLYRLQSAVSKQILEGYGYAEYAAAVTVPDESRALDELLTAGAVAQLALQGGYAADAERVESLVRGELFEVPTAEGMEYLADYAKGMIDGFGGTEEELLQTAVALKTLTLCAEDYMQALVQADKNKSVQTLLEELNESLASVPLTRADGEAAALSQPWLEDTLYLYTHYQ